MHVFKMLGRLVFVSLLTLVFAITLFGTNAYAAHSESQHTSRATMPLTTLTVKCTNVPSCNLQRNAQYNFRLDWSNGSLFAIGFSIHWNDGHYDSYQCIFNCMNGYTSFNHAYTKAGSYPVYVDSSDGNSSNILTVHVK